MENNHEELTRFQSAALYSRMDLIRDNPRAQRLRWFHSMAEDTSSAFYTEPDLEDLLNRARDSFRGAMED